MNAIDLIKKGGYSSYLDRDTNRAIVIVEDKVITYSYNYWVECIRIVTKNLNKN